ncbi:uncharacterized protein LOC127245699 [Andrographis paniculata]|uniref:uncharacterized protein LOC127245699 n=1 Tax=Andrographis paniculata TaxID=175694 RepID=UPI0021E95B23|nr:uncharacterized protein LOC127245699 [Andrographis paniculata]
MADQSPNTSSQSTTDHGSSPNLTLFLVVGNHPGMALTSVHLTDSNYLSWSINIETTLMAKSKVGCIDETLVKLPEGTPEFNQWRACDAMIRSWLRNSISANLQEGFVYVNSTRELWLRAKEKFGQANGVLIYQLKAQIGDLKQGSDMLTTYYTKLEKLVDELRIIEPGAKCKCDKCRHEIDKVLARIYERDYLVQFLTGLNKIYQPIKNQILMMDPLPTVNKAFAMLLQVEKQNTHIVPVDLKAFNVVY